MSKSLEMLVREYKAGSVEAFEELVENDKVQAILNHICYNERVCGYEPDDLKQEILLKFTSALQNYDPEKAGVTTYLGIVARTQVHVLRRMANYNKRKANNFSISIEVGQEDYGFDVIDRRAEDDYREIDGLDYVNRVELTEMEKRICDLFMQDYSKSEVAKRCGITASAVRYYTKRLQKKFKEAV